MYMHWLPVPCMKSNFVPPPKVRQKEQGDDEAQGIDETFIDA
jgi:hypothetical protein